MNPPVNEEALFGTSLIDYCEMHYRWSDWCSGKDMSGNAPLALVTRQSKLPLLNLPSSQQQWQCRALLSQLHTLYSKYLPLHPTEPLECLRKVYEEIGATKERTDSSGWTWEVPDGTTKKLLTGTRYLMLLYMASGRLAFAQWDETLPLSYHDLATYEPLLQGQKNASLAG